MSAGEYDITIEQGADWELILTWNRDGEPVDLTDYTARMMARRRITDSYETLSITTDDAITLGGVAGTITILLKAAETSALRAGTNVYDLELVSPSGVVTRLIEGALWIDPEVTR